MNDLLQDSRRGTVAFMLATHPSNIWPMIEDAGLKWPSRHPTFWMLDAMLADQKMRGSLPPELAALAKGVRKETVEDLFCNPPQLILVDDFAGGQAPRAEIIRFFEENTDFREFFSHYEKIRTIAKYTSYRRRDTWEPITPGDCRSIY